MMKHHNYSSVGFHKLMFSRAFENTRCAPNNLKYKILILVILHTEQNNFQVVGSCQLLHPFGHNSANLVSKVSTKSPSLFRVVKRLIRRTPSEVQ